MIDPEKADAVLREYHATASRQQLIDDLRRHSPELARRLGVDSAPSRRNSPSGRGVRGLFAAFGRSVQRLFS
jgi:hypothetical protein